MIPRDAKAEGGAGERTSLPRQILERILGELRSGTPRPASTYRLQLTPTWGFKQAAKLVPYLADLGVTHLYLAPIFTSTRGSTHGYDVVDHRTIREELGGEAGFAELADAARAHGLGIILDFVPNHMGIGPENAWWMDVLENGPSSVYAPYFDIDWRPVKQELANKVLVPVLGEQFGEVLERGELKLSRERGAFLLSYYEHRFPIAPRQVPRILRHRLPELIAETGETEDVQELESIATALEKLAPRHEVDPEKVAERAREKEVAKRRLERLCDESPRIRRHIDENVALFNGKVGDPRSFDLLEGLLDDQAYRLAHWRVAGEEINYRRFFDINALAAIRMEDARVFADTHRLVFRLLREGAITGLRIDHPDGLYAPTSYFRLLQETYVVERALDRWVREGGGDAAAAEDPALREALAAEVRKAFVRGAIPSRPLYVVVEKILEGQERMPASWQVDGTTGYDFLNAVNGLFVASQNARAFDNLYARFLGERVDFGELIYDKKQMILRSSMASELAVLAHRLNRISETNRKTRDHTLSALTRALVEFVACLPIYRTYVEGETAESIEARDRQYVERAIADAKRRAPSVAAPVFDFLRDTLLLRFPPEASPVTRRDIVEFVRKVQQVTGPVTAKAVEDTVFYIYARLLSLNEVGSDAERFGFPLGAFHHVNYERLRRWPGSLSTTATHDTKRGEDTRLRIDALSEIPGEWGEAIRRFARMNRRHKRPVDGDLAPSRNDELLLYQTLVGAFPDGEPGGPGWDEFAERICAYMDKAIKEAKVRSSWTNPNDAYHEAVRGFARRLLASSEFLAAFLPLQRRVAAAARVSALAQVAIKVMSPGVPDVYQGCELWDLSLVDPDNRRPVDYDGRRRLVEQLDARLREGPEARLALARELASPEAMVDGAAKLLLLRETLRLRREDPQLFLEGEYLPLEVEGLDAGHVVAFGRRLEDRTALCVVPRLLLSLSRSDEADRSARIGEAFTMPELRGRVVLAAPLARTYVDVVTGARVVADGGGVELAALFGDFPAAVLKGT